jgi:hypothetical protein
MNGNQPATIEQVLIERQSRLIGQLSTQLELMSLRLEQATMVCHKFGVNIDGSPLEEVTDDGDQRNVDESANHS